MTVVALVGLAPAAAVADVPAPQVEKRREIALSLLPMGLGKFTASPGGMTATADAAFSYGVGLRAGYALWSGLTLGLAPQAFFNVKPKEQPGAGAQQFDLMLRVAYTLPVVETIALYAEALPGYSLIRPPDGDVAKGPVLGMGVGAAIDLADQLFAHFGVGYQVGLQKLPAKDAGTETRTRYLRMALGVGARF